MGFKLGLLAILLLCLPPSAWAQSETPLDQSAHQIYSTVMSPFCPGRLLNDCPSPDAADLKHRIREELAGGQSPDAIVQGLVAKYGDKLRAAPGFSGFGAAAYLVPIIFLLFGAVAIAFWLRRARNTVGAAEEPEAAVDPAVAEEIERIIRD